MTTTLTAEPATCSTCKEPAQCLVVTIADDPADTSRSALTLRTMIASVCRRCIDSALTQRTFARSRFSECPVATREDAP